MKTMLSFSSVIVCLICLFLLVPIAGAQETEVAEDQYFGSQKNKRTRIGFYKYRLETLEQDPDKYFSEPEKFEGNIKAAD